MQDVIIQNGTIIDGTGGPAFSGGVAVRDGLITAVGDVAALEAKRVIDAAGRAIAPGFIDAHCHSDLSFLRDDRSESRIYQGVTTEACGQCGGTYFPCLPGHIPAISTATDAPEIDEWAAESFADFLAHAAREGKRMSTNLCQLVGHGTLRAGVMGYDDRAPTAAELAEMQRLLERDLACGAFGLSLGLEYTPGCFAKPGELHALSEVVRAHDSLVTVHMRSEGDFLIEAIHEVLDIGRATGARVHISHLKIDRPHLWGKAPDIWRLIQDAREAGVQVSADMYPYEASATGITNRCPKWAIEGGVERAAELLMGRRREEILSHLRMRFPDRTQAERCLIASTYGVLPEADGRNLHEVAALLGLPYAEAAAELIVRTRGNTSCIFFVMDLRDVEYFLRQDTGICSDGYGYPFDPALVSGRPHPRSYGAFTRFLRLRRERALCTLPEAVRRITGKAADMLRLSDRGRLQAGLAADITVFDPETIADMATYLDPFQKPVGVDWVLVNGLVALENGVQTGVRAGRHLLRPPKTYAF